MKSWHWLLITLCVLGEAVPFTVKYIHRMNVEAQREQAIEYVRQQAEAQLARERSTRTIDQYLPPANN